MPIPIPIPIGTRHIAAVRGTVWKFVSCTHCQERYAYLLELEATGEDHDLLFLDGQGSAERARAQAERNLLQKSHNIVLPVPCPSCGSYQDDMSKKLREDASVNRVQIVGLVIALLSLIPLMFDMANTWVLTVLVALVGLTLVTYGTVLAFRFDPNAGDPEPRKALGKRHAVWGEQLTELLATSLSAEQRTPANQPREEGPSSQNVKPA
jgi:hypothetical protein